LRLRALAVLAKDGGEVSTSSVAESIGHPTATVRRSLEDLNAHSLLERRKNGAGKADVWSLSDWAAERWNAIR
jgi:DNA-binding IclR family transcriptional regulator